MSRAFSFELCSFFRFICLISGLYNIFINKRPSYRILYNFKTSTRHTTIGNLISNQFDCSGNYPLQSIKTILKPPLFTVFKPPILVIKVL